jgi:hypothetical protein
MTTAPMNPLAGPAGPGKFSTRTDNLQMGSIGYGEGVDTQAIKSGAPLSKTPDAVSGPTGRLSQAQPQASLTGLYDPTQRPDEPITSGIDMGAGPGSNALNAPAQVQSQYTNAYDVFQAMASNPNASPTMKYLAQRIQLGF